VTCETIRKSYVVLRFLRFFSKSKNHDFSRFFELLHTFSRTLPSVVVVVVVVVVDCELSTGPQLPSVQPIPHLHIHTVSHPAPTRRPPVKCLVIYIIKGEMSRKLVICDSPRYVMQCVGRG